MQRVSILAYGWDRTALEPGYRPPPPAQDGEDFLDQLEQLRKLEEKVRSRKPAATDTE